MSDPTPSSCRYRAFISYSHRDRRWGDWLHRAIETWRVPKNLVGTPGRDGPIPARLAPVFRDREELPTATDLGQAISEALENSLYLLVICSPAAAASHWVNEEILRFKRLGRAHRILALIVDGEPGDPARECFPPALKYELDSEGRLTDRRTEPIAADARPQGDGRNDARLKLLAGLLGVGFDKLRRREQQRRQRRLIGFAGFALLLACVLGALAVTAWVARSEAQANLAEARRNLSRIYQDRAREAQEHRDITRQAVYLAHAMELDPGSLRPEVIADLAGRTGSLLWSVDLGAPLNCCAVSPAGDRLLAGAADGSLHELDLKTGKKLRSLPGHTGPVLRVAYHPAGDSAASAGADRTARLWDLSSGSVRHVLNLHERFVTSVSYSHDGATLFTTSDDRRAAAWNPATGELLRLYAGHTEGVNAAACSPDGRLLATASDDKTVRLWETASGRELRVLQGHEEDVSRVRFLSSGQVVSCSGDGSLRIWDIEEGREIQKIPAHGASISALGASADGSLLLSGGADRVLRTWRPDTGEPIHGLTGHEAWVREAVFVAGDRRVLSCAQDQKIRLWALPPEGDLQELNDHEFVVRRAAFSPDGSHVVSSGDDRQVRLWSAHNGNFCRPGPVTKDRSRPFCPSPALRACCRSRTMKRCASGNRNGTNPLRCCTNIGR